MPKLPPEHLEIEQTVENMALGDTGYVSELSLDVYDDDTAYLQGNATVYEGARGSRLYVEKCADGFYVRLAKGTTFRLKNHQYKWVSNYYEVVSWLE